MRPPAESWLWPDGGRFRLAEAFRFCVKWSCSLNSACIFASFRMRMLLVGLVAWLFIASDAHALEYVTFHRDGKESQVTGRLIVKATDGGVMLMSADGQL